MSHQKIRFIVWLFVFLSALALLFTGSPSLEYVLLKKPYLPFGTLISWLGMIALPMAIYWGSKKLRNPVNRINRFLSRILNILIVLAILWAPICFLLAGNPAFNFSEVEGFQGGQAAMRLFWAYSYGLPLICILLLLVFWLTAVVRKLRRNS